MNDAPKTGYPAGERLSHCPICDGEKFSEVFGRGVFYNRIEELTEVRSVLCEGCGVVFNNPRVRYEDLVEFYRSMSGYSGNTQDPTELAGVAESRKSRQRIELIEPYLQRGVNMLELGGGSFNFGVSLARRRPDVRIQELEPSLHESFDVMDNLRMVKGHLDSEVSGAGFDTKFGCIAALHVLEHQPNPVTFLKKLRNMMEDDGHLFIEVPNPYAPFYGRKGVELFFRAVHLFNFSRRSLELALSRAGFAPVKWGLSKPTVIQVVCRGAEAEAEVHEPLTAGRAQAIRRYFAQWERYGALKAALGESYPVRLYAKLCWGSFLRAAGEDGYGG